MSISRRWPRQQHLLITVSAGACHTGIAGHLRSQLREPRLLADDRDCVASPKASSIKKITKRERTGTTRFRPKVEPVVQARDVVVSPAQCRRDSPVCSASSIVESTSEVPPISSSALKGFASSEKSAARALRRTKNWANSCCYCLNNLAS